MYNIHTNTSSSFKNKQKFFSAFPCLVTVSAYAKFKTDQKKRKKKTIYQPDLTFNGKLLVLKM